MGIVDINGVAGRPVPRPARTDAAQTCAFNGIFNRAIQSVRSSAMRPGRSLRRCDAPSRRPRWASQDRKRATIGLSRLRAGERWLRQRSLCLLYEASPLSSLSGRPTQVERRSCSCPRVRGRCLCCTQRAHFNLKMPVVSSSTNPAPFFPVELNTYFNLTRWPGSLKTRSCAAKENYPPGCLRRIGPGTRSRGRV